MFSMIYSLCIGNGKLSTVRPVPVLFPERLLTTLGQNLHLERRQSVQVASRPPACQKLRTLSNGRSVPIRIRRDGHLYCFGR